LLEMVDLVRFGLTLDPDTIYSGGLTLRDLQSYETAAGASVLRIVDPYAVRAAVDGVWETTSITDSNRSETGACRPAPSGAPVIPDALIDGEKTAQSTSESSEAAADENAADDGAGE